MASSRLSKLALVLALVAFGASAQERVRGTISSIEGDTIVVAGKRIRLGDRTEIVYLQPILLGDLKPGDFLGVTSRKGRDGQLTAVEIRRFPKPLNPGHRPFDGRDDQTMTNASVEALVQAATGRELTLTYPGGSQKVVVPESASISTQVAGNRSHLVPGAPVNLTHDASEVALRIQVGPKRKTGGMNRRRLLLLALSAALAPLAASAQRGRARVGWLSYLPQPDPALGLLQEGLRQLGHVEGKSYVIAARYADNDFKRLPALVEELVAERIDVLVSRGPSVDFTRPVRDRVPVVFVYSGDPIAAGFADSLGKPGRNMTGMTMMAMELCAKRVELLKELLPGAKRIALLSNPEHAGELLEYRVTEDSARRLGAEVTRYLVHAPQELAPAFAAIRAAKFDATLVFPDSLTLNRRQEIAGLAADTRIPCMYGWTEFVDAGGLVSYGPTLTEGFRALAVFTDKILKGANASMIPIEQARSISLTLNMAVARALGIKVPPALLARADRVIE